MSRIMSDSPETIEVNGVWYDRRDTVDALTGLLAEARKKIETYKGVIREYRLKDLAQNPTAPPSSAEIGNARPLSEWHEDMGPVLWWSFPVEEPPYCGTPHDLGQTVEITARAYGIDKLMRFTVGGWPDNKTHWTPLPPPPSAP